MNVSRVRSYSAIIICYLVAPLVLYHHLLTKCLFHIGLFFVIFYHLFVPWVFCSYSTPPSSTDQLVVPRFSSITYRPNSCSSCSLPSYTDPMVVPVVLFYHLLGQCLFLLVYYHLLVQWLPLLYATIIYWHNGCFSYTLTSSTGPMVVLLVVLHHVLTQ